MSLPVVEGWCCTICENEFDRGARSAERSMCPCGATLCFSCRADPRNNQAVCPFCGLATDTVRFEPFRRDPAEHAAQHNEVVFAVQGQRARLLQHDLQLDRHDQDLGHTFAQIDRLLGVYMTHNNLLRLFQRRITELEAQVSLMQRRVEV
jgi:hypothetical protein